MFQATIAPIGGNLTASALVACLPLLAFFIMLLGVKAKAHVSGLVALVVAIIVAVAGWGMPFGFALSSALQGACYGAFPIAWIVIMAVWFYRMGVVSGRFEDLRSFFDQVGGGDIRIQAILIAFCFGGLLEALAGFGAPIAITATMILALGVKPKRAAMAVLIANTAPVAYGAIGTPILTAGSVVSGGDAIVSAQVASHVAAIVGFQAPLFALIVPFLLLVVLDGTKGLKDCWPPALVTGLSFALVQHWCSNFFAFELTDVIAAIVSMVCVVVFMKFWAPHNVNEARERFGLAPVEEGKQVKLSAVRTWMCLLPYLIVVVVFAVCKLGIGTWLATFNFKFAWPVIGGQILNAMGTDPGTSYTLNWFTNPGFMLLVAGLITAVIYSIFDYNGKFHMTMGQATCEIGKTFYDMRFAALTMVLVLSLAYVMNFSGQTISIGEALAASGPLFALISPILGWVGTAVTGSDTSANALFSSLQYQAAASNPSLAAVSPDLFLASNTMGGVVGKMISPQSLAIAAGATGERESDIMRSVLPWSIGFLIALCALVFLQATVLAFILP